MNKILELLSSLSDQQKQELIKALSEMGDETEQKTDNTTPKSPSVDNNFIVKRADNNNNNRRREPVKARKNQWHDSGEFKDIETPKVDRVARNRPQHKKVDVECSVCGKSFKVDPKYVYGEYHRCNRCVGR